MNAKTYLEELGTLTILVAVTDWQDAHRLAEGSRWKKKSLRSVFFSLISSLTLQSVWWAMGSRWGLLICWIARSVAWRGWGLRNKKKRSKGRVKMLAVRENSLGDNPLTLKNTTQTSPLNETVRMKAVHVTSFAFCPFYIHSVLTKLTPAVHDRIKRFSHFSKSFF